MTLILKLLIVQCLEKGTLKKKQKTVIETEAPLAVMGRGFSSCTTGFLGHP